MLQSNFNKKPVIRVDEGYNSCFSGWESIFSQLKKKIEEDSDGITTVVVECYQGVFFDKLLLTFKDFIKPDRVITSQDFFLSEEEVKRITFPDVTDDRIFGFLTRLHMEDFTDHLKVQYNRNSIKDAAKGVILVFGYGASLLVDEPTLLVYADMPRWEIQLRMRSNQVDNLGIRNRDESIEAKYKRGFFVDWRVCDRLKKKLMNRWDYVLDTTRMDKPVMVAAKTFEKALDKAISQPFSLMPYFDEGPWGGQWMKQVCNLDAEIDNYAWCFNCVPEENSLLFAFGETIFETPSINLVFARPRQLLGEAVHARFGDEFPIRFDFLDTMGGGNLSLQVHPLTEYIQEKFGIHYTQDESYYLLDVGEGASVYLGLKEGTNPDQMIFDLRKAQENDEKFEAEKYVECWPANKHDHFLIPGGTVHCSGKNCLVLEISSTPYIFTFKLWDWDRLGLDGKPRPINIDHGINVIQWDRTTSWTKNNLINRIRRVAQGDGWVEESTGLHEREFIETRRHWFSKKVLHQTNGKVNVLNLVEGREVVVESPTHAFDPFIVHYAETFIVPAYVDEYTISPHGESQGKRCATIKAFVRT
ncbi:MAG: class I mannose-6-phosphate isomerase [Bacteroidales bacterium]|nr:class I mannose-6-phosphate isomerase [Bacteroidales bacterium]HOC36876.1 class I mannose-6-phosphate isomerase [Tenuifilaceae bacterium]MBP8643384.1 class I mannose-6-phosphate isomerase [Bacteroidales bacterium]HOG72712.1 class I mannose-6-phosphate isomerase [Tenuifilaceae bacterium]HOW21655.1 class I mannose-6-phosphate isomerase [Tenuifilaceae bacterium]